MYKFCGNPKCINHVDVQDGVTRLRRYIDIGEVNNNLLISKASSDFGEGDKIRSIRLCDCCKEAIEIYKEFSFECLSVRALDILKEIYSQAKQAGFVQIIAIFDKNKIYFDGKINTNNRKIVQIKTKG